MSKLSGLVRTLFWIKGSIIAGLAGAYLLYDNIQPVKEMEYNLFDKNQKTEQGFFQDPPGLKTMWKPNSKGNIESYLQYESHGKIFKEVPIMSDLLPSTEYLVQGLNNRINMQGVLLEVRDNMLYGTFKDSSGTYTRPVDPSLFKSQGPGYHESHGQRVLDSVFTIINKYIGGE